MAGFNLQTKALFRKSVAYQRKNWGTNCCLLWSPIVFTIILYALQVVIDNSLDTPENRCGCKCIECWFEGNDTEGGEYSQQDCPINPSQYKRCEKYDEDVCGVEYSSAEQVAFCEVRNPSIWPPIQQVPRPEFRAKENSPKITFLYTGAQKDIAAELSQYLFAPEYDFTVSFQNLVNNSPLFNFTGDESILDVLPLLQELNITSVDLNSTQVDEYTNFLNNGIDLSNAKQAGFILGSSTETIIGTSLLSPAFFPTDEDDKGQPVYIVTRNCSITVEQLRQYLNLPNIFTNEAVEAYLQDAGVNVTDGVFDIADLVNNPSTAWVLTGQLGPINVLTTYECVESAVDEKSSVQEINDALYCGFKQARCEGFSELNEYSAAFDWKDTDDNNLILDIWHNDTNEVGGDDNPPSLQRFSEDMNQGVKAWLQWMSQGLISSPLAAQIIGLMDMPKLSFELRLEISSLIGTLFYLWLIQLIVPVMLYQLVYEKEQKLRMMMNMHGLSESVYWLVNYIWYLTLYCAYIVVLLIVGSLPVFDLAFFRLNNYVIQIIFYFLYGNVQIAFTFLVTCFFGSARTAVVTGLLWVLASSLIGAIILGQLYQTNRWYVALLELVPQFGAYRGLYELSQYSFLGTYKNSNGLEFENLSDDDNGMVRIWIYFIVEWAVFMVLAWYLQQVLDSGTGVRKHPLFFLDSCRKKTNKVTIEFSSVRSSVRSAPGLDGELSAEYQELKEDVLREKERVENMRPEQLQNTAIVVSGLQKVFPAMDGNPAKVAVRSLTLAVEKGEVFGLLGPNGAGKSTSINMLVGLLEPTQGNAVIGGYNIRTQMNDIYKDMGVCPQHDLLWENLTGREHLFFYARLKGTQEFDQLKAMVDVALSSVNLLYDGDKKVKEYSGGMKRRLSVAISLIGDPGVVYMDEPSTGLDPSSRHLLWDVVKSQKENRAIILTTHSMEEAEILCDRLGIFVEGRLVCIGNPKQITSRYAGYFVFTIMVPQEQEPQALQIVKNMSPNAEITYQLGGLMKFELPSNEVTLSQVFATMEDAKRQIQILDWAVTSATLEEVFIKLARQVEAKSSELQLS
eukprot:TRINITY_DN286_c0_g1_i4.p1 TRINITY_DN286_c0_g1~~TRINITY_DN286_c0_g1_i4.p1  ORF type:complete len:1073 (-),score=121.43 TRINITY_DN286_c0_g1_i4:266-3484(-)